MWQSRWRIVLRPLAYLYGLGVSLRNLAFDCGLLRECSFPIPIICVGNISVGGTGKTPHVEYILRLLTPRYRVAVLSRGYKRKTRGLIEATLEHTAEDIGDEPLQIKRKYPEIRLIVNGNRVKSMEYLMSLDETERPEVVIMDDGLQHRYLRPSYRIMLVDSSNLLSDDYLLPEGKLREPAKARYRMDCIIFTKCSPKLKPIEQRGLIRSMALYPYQKVFFTSINYRFDALPLVMRLAPSQDTEDKATLNLTQTQVPVLLLSGIANPKPLIDAVSNQTRIVGELHYPDHYNFTESDLTEIKSEYERLKLEYPQLIILTTEKDALRLSSLLNILPESVQEDLYYLPIRITILNNKEEEFERIINFATKAKPQALQS